MIMKSSYDNDDYWNSYYLFIVRQRISVCITILNICLVKNENKENMSCLLVLFSLV